jgi:hypothetical protein
MYGCRDENDAISDIDAMSVVVLSYGLMRRARLTSDWQAFWIPIYIQFWTFASCRAHEDDM